jgi:O-antigen ligase
LDDSGIRHPRSSSVFDNSNVLASYLVVLLGISLGMLTKYYPKNPRNCSGIFGNLYGNQVILLIKAYIFFDLIAIVCTQSRNALLVTVILFCTSIVFLKLGNLHFSSLLIVTIIGFCLLKNITLIRYVSGDLSLTSSMARELLTFATDSRTKIWEVAVSLGKERPFLGWGLGNYKLLYPVQSIGTPPHPHNFWLMLFAETGIMGTVSLNMFVGSILYQAVRRIDMIEKEEKSILISYLMAFSASVIFHFFDCPLFDFRINCLNWIVLAGIFSLSSKKSIVIDENTIRLSAEMTHHNVVFADHATQAYIKPDQAKKISG